MPDLGASRRASAAGHPFSDSVPALCSAITLVATASDRPAMQVRPVW